jgi:hypothetical protein
MTGTPLMLLRGLTVAAPGDDDPAFALAAGVLRGLGARVEPGRRGAIRLMALAHPTAAGDVALVDAGVPLTAPGLPPGALDVATGTVLAAAAVLCALGRGPVEVERRAVLAQLMLPWVVGEPPRRSPPHGAVCADLGAPGDAEPPRRSPPRGMVRADPGVQGDAEIQRRSPPHGAVCADLGAPGDAERFATLLEVTPPAVRDDPERLAAEAQEWRLPVTPYRRRGAVDAAALGVLHARPSTAPCDHDHARPHLRAPRVVDMTAMWSGPLATGLLAALGADVAKVEPAVRPDGLRARPAQFAALNADKRALDLDLRDAAARAALHAELDGAALLVENLSPRVLPNFGLAPAALAAAHPGLTVLSLPAFAPDGPDAGWTAYGTGVHAATGLGDLGDGRFAAPVHAYPDPLAGLLAFAVALAVLYGRAEGGWRGGHVIVPMSAAVAPLLRHAPDPRWARPEAADEAAALGRALSLAPPLRARAAASVTAMATAGTAG